MIIDHFSGEYRPLSNFWYTDVRLGEIIYPSVEHAYQAAKTFDISKRIEISLANTPGQAKRLGRAVVIRDDWELIKRKIMLQLLQQKFENNIPRVILQNTGDVLLIEGNNWHDNYWGICFCSICGSKGHNWLGKLLMHIRFEINL